MACPLISKSPPTRPSGTSTLNSGGMANAVSKTYLSAVEDSSLKKATKILILS